MKGLYKVLYPAAPDQSGAVSVLYALGGMIVILDAGGCTGNICGFDEPRWEGTKSAVFSAGLRDMDAILGRDDLLISKIEEAAGYLHPKFVSLIGTPVPATIGTDYRALVKIIRRKTGLPAFFIGTNGICWYDEGASAGYLALIREFAGRNAENISSCAGESEQKSSYDPAPGTGQADPAQSAPIPHSAGVLGFTPLDFHGIISQEEIREQLHSEGITRILMYGMDPTEELAAAGCMQENLVAAPSGLAAARELKKRYGTPYRCCCLAGEKFMDAAVGRIRKPSRILIIHQQILANDLRNRIRAVYPDAVVQVAGFFMMDDTLREPGDITLHGEEDLAGVLAGKKKEHRKDAAGECFDIVMADTALKRAAGGWQGEWIDLPHFALSGRK